MVKLAPQAITLKSLKDGDFTDVFPQFYRLKNTKENSAYHNHQSVYDHVIAVLEGLEKLFALAFIKNESLKAKLQTYLVSKLDKVSHQTLIFLATVFHDMGKAEVLIETALGNFSAPGHELTGVSWARRCLQQVDLTEVEKEWIYQFVLAHGYMHGLVSVKLQRSDRDFFAELLYAMGDLAPGLLLFVYAHLLGSDLQQADPNDYQAKINAVEEMIGWLDETL